MLDLLFTDRLPSPAEREAVADEPRAGIWWQPGWMTGGPHDQRELTQEQTDSLIGLELRQLINDHPDGPMTRATSAYAPASIDVVIETPSERRVLPSIASVRTTIGGLSPRVMTLARTMHRQRTGIHSDPLIRLLAYRAWGDRDRVWKKLVASVLMIASNTGASITSIVNDMRTLATSNIFAGPLVYFFDEIGEAAKERNPRDLEAAGLGW